MKKSNWRINNNWLRLVFMVIINTVIILLLSELTLRLLGYETYSYPEFEVSFDPSSPYEADNTYGISLKPGCFNVLINSGCAYTATHTKLGNRVTKKSNADEVGVFTGCSFTYGQGVNDYETYPYLVSDAIEDIRFVNAAVPGYGTVQAYLLMKERIEKQLKTDYLILNYLPFHNERNTLARSYREQLFVGLKSVLDTDKSMTGLENSNYPFAGKKNNQLVIQHVPLLDIYFEMPYRSRFVLMNMIQKLINNGGIDKERDLEVTLTLIEEINGLTKNNNTKFMISFMMNDPISKKIKGHCESLNITVIDASVDFSKRENTNLPYDPHPSVLAHKHIAKKLISGIQANRIK